MEPKKEASFKSIIVGAFCIIMAAAGGISLHSIISQLSGWQAAGYVLVGGIFIALAAVIINEILSFHSGD